MARRRMLFAWDMVAYLEYDAFPPHAVTVRLVCKIGEKVHTLDVLSSRWLDAALETLDKRACAKKLS
jgi:hypothetical protein